MNPNLNKKKQISDRKFSRIFEQNLHSAGVAYKTDRNWNTVNSLQAVLHDKHIYAKFACKGQGASRLKTFCVRYSVEEPLDFIFFMKYPSPVLKPVEF